SEIQFRRRQFYGTAKVRLRPLNEAIAGGRGFVPLISERQRRRDQGLQVSACPASGDNQDPAHCPMMPRPGGEWDRADGSKDIEGYRRPAGSDLALSRRLGTPWDLD